LKELDEAESAIMIAVVDDQVHIAYSLDLEGEYDELLDILETACIMVATEQQKKSDGIVH
jgi:hypothetical protein